VGSLFLSFRSIFTISTLIRIFIIYSDWMVVRRGSPSRCSLGFRRRWGHALGVCRPRAWGLNSEPIFEPPQVSWCARPNHACLLAPFFV